MFVKSSDHYISNRAWLRDAVGGKNVILCHTSALEFLEFFNGYFGESEIDVYSTEKGEYDNANYHIVDSFDNIDYFSADGVLCTSFSQTINDMLSDDNSDSQALYEALSNFYFSNGESFDGLIIMPENVASFDNIKKNAISYYNGG